MPTFQTGVQYGFFFDESRCVDCRACVIACLDWYDVQPGAGKPARMFSWEEGTFPSVKLHLLFAPCYHCAKPVCVDAAQGAMFKEPNYGAVLIDSQQATHSTLRDAAAACPYGAISFESDALDAKAVKCTMCIDRLTAGTMPVCVNACPMRALDFDTLDNLKKKYGTKQQLPGMPDPSPVGPAVVFKEQFAKTNLVPYDTNAAQQLMMSRPSGLPGVFSSVNDLKPASASQIGRGQLKLKAAGANDFVRNTQNDES